jgi:ubiquinone/menaquinone biosynthesis C-methylase UbiE
VADWYDQLVGAEGSEYHREVVLPGTLRLLKPQPGQRVLDVACGQGVLARLLATRGVEVVGVESARSLISSAKKHDASLPSQSPKPVYHLADARELGFLPADQFDAAACVLAIQNINPIVPVFGGVARALKHGGCFVVVMMHPCFRSPKETHWGWDEQQQVQYRRVDRYLLPRKSPIVARPGADPGTYTWTFHRPIEDYIRVARNAGLLIDALEEWPSHKQSAPGKRSAAENRARKEIPMFLAMRCVKVSIAGEVPAR